MGKIGIAEVLPHRYPFLLVDKILETEYMKRSKGYKNISLNEPWATGHFPEDPVYPGVLMIETMAQVGGFIFYDPVNSVHSIQLYLCAVKDLKLFHKVVPGDMVVVEAELTDTFANFYTIKCIARVEDKVVAKGLLTLAESS